MNKKYNCIELFAGAGGFGTGFKNLGFNIVSANDIWEPASRTYCLNHPKVKYIIDDISKINGEKLLDRTGFKNSDIDVIIGGPPCQGFSTLGKRFIEDPRNKLFKEYVRIVNEIQPKIFVMENVSGILSMENGEVLNKIKSSFNEIGYRVEYRLLNAAEYGVPQQRERTIFIGTKLNIDIKYPEKTHTLSNNKKLKKAVSLWEAIGDLPQSDNKEIIHYDSVETNSYQKKMRNKNDMITNHIPSSHNNKAIELMKYIPKGKSAWDVEGIPADLKPKSGYGNTYARLNPDEPGMTITRNFACISSSRCIHPFLNRGLTAREAARIQSYPDNYKFIGSKTDIHIQIGNSVPPLLAEKIAENIKIMLDEIK